LTAAALTIGLAAVIFAISGVFGLLLALAGYGRKKSLLRAAVEIYSAALRSVPELVVLFLFFFGGPQLGIDELALESGVVSKEHVLNLLSRLLEADAPAPIDTPTGLTLLQEPQANVNRYDHLRGEAHAS
jgi:His/Glu/Gln/Arg/opine family amino acid ABC transporter permease subunit